MSQGILCVFTTAPEPGLVKTRLATVLGAAGAAALARAFLVDTWEVVSSIERGRPVLVVDGDGELPRLAPDPELWPQGAGDLGQRMQRVLARALERAPWAIALGTDSPGMPASLIERAAELLSAGARSVIGPSDDGGIYLLGLSRLPEGLLDELPWSSADKAERTILRLREHGLEPHVLDSWYDVDEPADLARLRRGLKAGRIAAPATQRVVRELRR